MDNVDEVSQGAAVTLPRLLYLCFTMITKPVTGGHLGTESDKWLS